MSQTPNGAINSASCVLARTEAAPTPPRPYVWPRLPPAQKAHLEPLRVLRLPTPRARPFPERSPLPRGPGCHSAPCMYPVLSPPRPHREAGKRGESGGRGQGSASRRPLPEPSAPSDPRCAPGRVLPPGGGPRRGPGSFLEPPHQGAHPEQGTPGKPRGGGIQSQPDSPGPRRAGINGRDVGV